MKIYKKNYKQAFGENPESAKLSDIASNLLMGKDLGNYKYGSHDALIDATATAQIFMRVI